MNPVGAQVSRTARMETPSSYSLGYSQLTHMYPSTVSMFASTPLRRQCSTEACVTPVDKDQLQPVDEDYWLVPLSMANRAMLTFAIRTKINECASFSVYDVRCRDHPHLARLEVEYRALLARTPPPRASAWREQLQRPHGCNMLHPVATCHIRLQHATSGCNMPGGSRLAVPRLFPFSSSCIATLCRRACVQPTGPRGTGPLCLSSH